MPWVSISLHKPADHGYPVNPHFCGDSTSILLLQDYTEETAMDHQSTAVVVDKAKLPELSHKAANPRPGCADHLCQAVLTDSGKHRFGSAALAIVSKQKEDLSQTVFA